MPARFVNIDRDTPMFLPCDLRHWVPAGHIVHFIIDAAEQIPTAHFHVNHRGTGSEQYPPAMMLALLICGSATGRFGSRAIEAAPAATWPCVTCAPTPIPITIRFAPSARPTKPRSKRRS